MNEMIERIAIACVRLELEQAGFSPQTPIWVEAASHPDLAIEQYGRFARAAIEAMREPTFDMVHEVSMRDDISAYGIRELWRELIDAALKEPDPA